MQSLYSNPGTFNPKVDIARGSGPGGLNVEGLGNAFQRMFTPPAGNPMTPKPPMPKAPKAPMPKPPGPPQARQVANSQATPATAAPTDTPAETPRYRPASTANAAGGFFNVATNILPNPWTAVTLLSDAGAMWQPRENIQGMGKNQYMGEYHYNPYEHTVWEGIQRIGSGLAHPVSGLRNVWYQTFGSG